MAVLVAGEALVVVLVVAQVMAVVQVEVGNLEYEEKRSGKAWHCVVSQS